MRGSVQRICSDSGRFKLIFLKRTGEVENNPSQVITPLNYVLLRVDGKVQLSNKTLARTDVCGFLSYGTHVHCQYFYFL